MGNQYEIDRSLVLTSQRELINDQVQGQDLLFLSEDTALMKGVSTDEILPSHAGRFVTSEELAPYALTGIVGVPETFVRDFAISYIFTGSQFGAGSSREHAVMCLQGTGIKRIFVVGGPAERIFYENALFLGGPEVVSVTYDQVNPILASLRAGEPIDHLEYKQNPVKKMILAEGGLYNFNIKRLKDEIVLPIVKHDDVSPNTPLTAVEKILARKMVNIAPNQHGERVVRPGDAGFAEVDYRFLYELHARIIFDGLRETFGPTVILKDPSSIDAFEDHIVWLAAQNPKLAELIEQQRQFSKQYGIYLHRSRGEDFTQGAESICHTWIVENAKVMPGDIVAGSDSHTCTAGVLNTLALGSGATSIANSLVTKDIYVEVPESIRVVLRGELPHNVSAKDVMLNLLASEYVKSSNAVGRVFEFSGPGLIDWPLDQQLVLTNMSVEGGATTGIITELTPALVEHLERVKGISRAKLEEMFVTSDPEASYVHTIEINLADIEPMVATPGHPTNGRPISELGEIAVTKAFIGSCTGGNLSDLEAVARVLMGRKIAEGVSMVIHAASGSIYKEAIQCGYDRIFEAAGAEFLPPGCGACMGAGPGGVELPDDVVISDTNRNFPGRMGWALDEEGERYPGQVYLANPAVTAASALKGYIAIPEV